MGNLAHGLPRKDVCGKVEPRVEVRAPLEEEVRDDGLRVISVVVGVLLKGAADGLGEDDEVDVPRRFDVLAARCRGP